MRRGWIEPPSARPVALRLPAFLSLRAALIRSGAPRARRLADQLGSSPRHPLCIGAWTPRTVQRAPRTGTVLSPGRCPEASREWVVTPPAGAAPAPPTAYLRMAAPRGRGGVRIGVGFEGEDKFRGRRSGYRGEPLYRMGEGAGVRFCARQQWPWRCRSAPMMSCLSA
jgi:hypothetical protein